MEIIRNLRSKGEVFLYNNISQDEYELIKTLKLLYNRCSEYFDCIEDDDYNVYREDKYVYKKYYHILELADECIENFRTNRLSSIPIILRTMIEDILEIIFIFHYDNDAYNYLMLQSKINDYGVYLKLCKLDSKILYDIVDIDKSEIIRKMKKIENERNRYLQELKESETEELRILYKETFINDNFNFSKFKRNQRGLQKELILQESDKFKRIDKYYMWYSILSKYVHSSCKINKNFKIESNVVNYVQIISSILKNGIYYTYETILPKMKDKNLYERIKELNSDIKVIQWNLNDDDES